MARRNATQKAAESRATATQGRCVIALAVTPDFKAHIEALAKSEQKSVSTFVALMARDGMNATYTAKFKGAAVPVRAAKAKKYATVEERKAAQAKAAKERNAKMAALLKAFNAGKIPASVLSA